MRGTPIHINRALSERVQVMGGERSLVIIACLFWGWAGIGLVPHWPVLIAVVGFTVTLYLLRFLAKCDPRGAAVFRKNSRFLIQNRLWLARGWAGNLRKTRRVQTVPVSLMSRY